MVSRARKKPLCATTNRVVQNKAAADVWTQLVFSLEREGFPEEPS